MQTELFMEGAVFNYFKIKLLIFIIKSHDNETFCSLTRETNYNKQKMQIFSHFIISFFSPMNHMRFYACVI